MSIEEEKLRNLHVKQSGQIGKLGRDLSNQCVVVEVAVDT